MAESSSTFKAVVLLLCALLVGFCQAQDVCVIPIIIDANQSNISLGGRVTKPLGADIVSLPPPASLGGTLYVVVPQAPCPNAMALPAALANAFLAQPEGEPSGLQTVPDAINAGVSLGGGIPSNLATATLQGFQGAVTSGPLANGTGTFSIKATAGRAVITSSLLKVDPVDIAGNSLNGSGCSLAAVAAPDAGISISCPQVSISSEINTGGATAVLVISGKLMGSGGLSGGKLMPAAFVGAAATAAGVAPPGTRLITPPCLPPAPPPAPPPSGDNQILGFLPFCIPLVNIGNCNPAQPPAPPAGPPAPCPPPVAVPLPQGSAAPAADPAAAAQPPAAAAFAGAAAAPANGTSNGTMNGTSAVVDPAATPITTAANATLPSASSGLVSGATATAAEATAGNRCVQGTLAPNGNCTCASGWEGRSCMQCVRDGVCPALMGADSGSTCNTSLAYSERTVYKAYTCRMPPGGIGDLVSGITGLCNVRGAKLPFEAGALLGMQAGALVNGTAPEDNRFCKLVVELVQEPNNPVACIASGCGFTPGAAGFGCAVTNCISPKGGQYATVINGVLGKLNGKPIEMDCDMEGKCTLKGMQPQLSVTCTAGECTQPSAGSEALVGGTLSTEPPPPAPTVAILAALLLMVLVLLAAVMGGYMASFRSFFVTHAGAGADHAAAVPLKLGSAGVTRRDLPCDVTGSPMEFKFEGVYCAVPHKNHGRHIGRTAAADTAAAGDDVRGSKLGSFCSGGLLEVSCLPKHAAPAAAGAAGEARAAGAAAADDPIGGDVFDGRGRRVVLHRVSGGAQEGEVLGVMGPSGSGKTTLLSILSGSLDGIAGDSTVEGAISLGGEMRRTKLRKVTAYVPQRDVLLPALTVEETIRYSALLRLPRHLSAAQVRSRVAGVLQELGLGRVGCSLVGGAGGIRGVSGGERRRVTIGMELVTSPKLVIMDEPTSGLDSYTAFNLMTTAHDIAAAGRIVIMSLHQPSPDMFGSLDTILLLARGHLVYAGPPANVAPYFALAGVPCPPGCPIAEHIMAAVSEREQLAALLAVAPAKGGTTVALPATAAAAPLIRSVSETDASEDASASSVTASGATNASAASAVQGGVAGTAGTAGVAGEVAAAAAAAAAADAADDAGDLEEQDAEKGHGPGMGKWRLGPHGLETMSPAVARAGPSAAPAGMPPAAPQQQAKPQRQQEHDGAQLLLTQQPGRKGFRYVCAAQARELAVLFWRTLTDAGRSPGLLLLHLGVGAAMGLLVGLLFFHLDRTQVGLQNRLGAIFFALALFGFTSLTIVDALVLERQLVMREVRARYYHSASYLAAKLVMDGLLLRTLPALLFTAFMYPMVGLLPEASRVFTFMFVLSTYACTVGALSVALTALCRSSAATTLTMNIILLVWVIVGGFLVNPLSIPGWIRWVRYLSPMSYAFEVLATNEMATQYFAIHVDGFEGIGDIRGDVFLRTLGLQTSDEHSVASTAALVAFYFGAVGLAFVLYALGSRRTGLKSVARKLSSTEGRRS